MTTTDRRAGALMLRQLREARGWSWADLARALRDTARQLAVTSLMHRQVASIQRAVARWESLTDRTSPGDRYQFLLAHLYARTPSGKLALGPGSDFDTLMEALRHFGTPPQRAQQLVELITQRSPVRLLVGSADYLDELVLHLREQWHVLVRTDNLLGPRFALTGVRDHIAIIEELLPVTSGRRQGELVTLAATYAESAAWLHEDAGQMSAATYWVGRAMKWAHEAGDDLLVAWTLFRRSQHAAAGGNAKETISLARAARRDGDRLPNPMRAAIVQQAAHGHALAGEEIMSHRTLDAAHQWAALDNAGDARGGHGSFCNETYLELQRAHCWTVLGKPQRAVQVYESALPSLPPVYRRDRGLACSRLAQAYVDAGQPEAAAEAGREALAIARSSGSVRTEQEVALVSRRLYGHHHLLPVAQLLHELSTVATA